MVASAFFLQKISFPLGIRLTRSSIFYIILITVFSSRAQNLNDSLLPIIADTAALKSVKTIAVLPIAFQCYNLTKGGIRLLDNAVSNQCRTHIYSGIETILASKGYSVLCDTIASDSVLELKPLIYAVERSIQTHIITKSRSNLFSLRLKNFDYSIGPIDGLCARTGCDAVLFISGFDEAKTNARRSALIEAQVAAVFGTLIGIASMATIGVGFFPGSVEMREDMTVLSGIMINRRGSIIWYNVNQKIESLDMNDTTVNSQVVKRMLVKKNRRHSSL